MNCTSYSLNAQIILFAQFYLLDFFHMKSMILRMFNKLLFKLLNLQVYSLLNLIKKAI